MNRQGGKRPLVVAEVAQAHDGSLGTALAYVDAVAEAGAHAVKFQTHIAEEESTPHEPWRVRFSPQDATRYDYWKRMEFSEAEWELLRARADERGIAFLSSPFSLAAIELLERVGVSAWKIASGEVSNEPMMQRIAATSRPVYLSTGMSPLAEIDAAVETLKGLGVDDITVFQCTSSYPTPPELVGLNVLELFERRYPDCGVGLSDHSGTIFPALGAAAMGVDVIEVHVCFDRATFGPDVPASVTLAELDQLVRGVTFLAAVRDSPVDKDRVAAELAPMRKLFMKSAVLTTDLSKGTVLSQQHLAGKKPGSGIPASAIPSLVGRTLARDLPRDHLIAEEDLEPDNASATSGGR